MAKELMRKEGGNIEQAVSLAHEELLDRIMRSDRLIIGLSGGGAHALPELMLDIHNSQPSARILVSSNLISEEHAALDLIQVDSVELSFDGAITALEGFQDTLSAPVS
jgi:hypothetical protein